MKNDKVIRLPSRGKLIVVADIHGNKEDFDKYIAIWDMHDPDCHILFTGDLIHGIGYDEDFSIEILEECMKYFNLPNFHVLLGNHELAQITNESVWKYGINQTRDFNLQLKYKAIKTALSDDDVVFNIDITEEYYLAKKWDFENFIKKFDYFCITENGFFFSHAGISDSALISLINKEVDLFNLDIDLITADYLFLEEMLWSRPYDDYVEHEIDIFLGIVDCKFMCVGHTPYNGCHILGKQLIFDSSFETENKYYLEIDLNKEYKDIVDVMKCLKEMK